MYIHVGAGIATGPTTMAAFDATLNEIGIANYNMLRLSSVVPPGARIVTHKGKVLVPMPGTWGDRMYVVMAEIRVDKPGSQAWAGVGWVRDKKTGRGMFTEHEGASEAYVRDQIDKSLEAFMTVRNQKGSYDWSAIQTKVIGATCVERPLCAMVAAIFQVSDWKNKPYFLGAQ